MDLEAAKAISNSFLQAIAAVRDRMKKTTELPATEAERKQWQLDTGAEICRLLGRKADETNSNQTEFKLELQDLIETLEGANRYLKSKLPK